ncbi:MAG: DoxX family protein, partial [Phycisphaerales bacterium JB038]
PTDDGLVQDEELPEDPIPGDTEIDPEAVEEAIEEVIEDAPVETPGDEPPAEVTDPETTDPETTEPPVDDPGLAYRQADGFTLVPVQNVVEGEGDIDPAAADTQPADAPAQPQYTPDRFPADGVQARALNKIILMLDGTSFQDYAIYLAWIAALTELIGGLLLIPGILSRVWGLGLAIAMGMAMWLTTIAPSVGNPDAFLGFWPSIAVDPGTSEWWALVTGFWQLALGIMALSIFLSGAGRISVDALFFGPGSGRKSSHAADD